MPAEPVTLDGVTYFMHSKRRRMASSSPAPAPKPSKGSAVVAKYRAKMNAMTDTERAANFESGMRLIYGGGDSNKAKVYSR